MPPISSDGANDDEDDETDHIDPTDPTDEDDETDHTDDGDHGTIAVHCHDEGSSRTEIDCGGTSDILAVATVAPVATITTAATDDCCCCYPN